MAVNWKTAGTVLCVAASVTTAWILPSAHFHPRHARAPHPARRRTASALQAASDEEQSLGLNELHTLLRNAVQEEDYMEAGRISDQLARRMYEDYDSLNADERKAKRRRMSWTGQGGAPWLTDRLDTLHYTFPTSIQINAFEAVNAILNSTDGEEETLEERVRNTDYDLGIVVSGTTGSGKTLSYAVPLLSTLSDSLFLRQRLRVSDEEAVGDTAGDLADRISVVTSPQVSSNRPSPKKPIATGASLATLGRSGTDVKSPLALVVVPTRELGVQTAMLLYQLVGGTIKQAEQKSEPEKETEESREQKKKAKKYKGPKGVRIGCVLDDEEAAFGLKLQTDIAVTTPQYLGKLIDDGDINLSKLRVIVFDEADLAIEQTKPETLSKLFDDDVTERDSTRLTLLVGASVTEALGNLAVSSRIIPHQSYIATANRFAPLTKSDVAIDELDEGIPTASLQDLNVCLYPGLKHERVVISNEESGLLVLTRLLRNELRDYDLAASATNGARSKKPIQRPRVVVFFPDEAQAKAAIEPLRDALWGEHRLCVLLPKTGVSPLTIMDQFKRNETSVMLSTPTSVRGLDFPELTHVYTLYLPIDDPREYLHLAGRVGRVGHLTEGRVVSVLKETEAEKLEDLAKTLGFEFTDVPAPASDGIVRTKDGEIDESSVDIEALRRSFEDTIGLVDLADDPPAENDPTVIDTIATDDNSTEDEDSFQ